ncbi:hypothetical protein D3C79_821620 [compost metagenome]
MPEVSSKVTEPTLSVTVPLTAPETPMIVWVAASGPVSFTSRAQSGMVEGS